MYERDEMMNSASRLSMSCMREIMKVIMAMVYAGYPDSHLP